MLAEPPAAHADAHICKELDGMVSKTADQAPHPLLATDQSALDGQLHCRSTGAGHLTSHANHAAAWACEGHRGGRWKAILSSTNAVNRYPSAISTRGRAGSNVPIAR